MRGALPGARVGISLDLHPVRALTADAEEADPADLIDTSGERRAAAERAMDRVRGKFGPEAMVKGLALQEKDDPALTPKSSKHKDLDR